MHIIKEVQTLNPQKKIFGANIVSKPDLCSKLQRENERETQMIGKRDKMVVILTFTWSIGFRLADCHMRHLNLVHSWRLE